MRITARGQRPGPGQQDARGDGHRGFLTQTAQQGDGERGGARPVEGDQIQADKEGRGRRCSKFHYWIKGGPPEAGRAPPRFRPPLLSRAPLWAAPLAAQGTGMAVEQGQDDPDSGPARRGPGQGRWLPAVRPGSPLPDDPGRTEPVKPATLATDGQAQARPAGLTEPARPYSRQLSGSPAGMVPAPGGAEHGNAECPDTTRCGALGKHSRPPGRQTGISELTGAGGRTPVSSAARAARSGASSG